MKPKISIRDAIFCDLEPEHEYAVYHEHPKMRKWIGPILDLGIVVFHGKSKKVVYDETATYRIFIGTCDYIQFEGRAIQSDMNKCRCCGKELDVMRFQPTGKVSLGRSR